MEKLREMIPKKSSASKPAPRTAYVPKATPAAGTPAQPQILGRLKMGHRVIQLRKKIGQGGYATVYLAQDENTYKDYVLKRMDCKVGMA